MRKMIIPCGIMDFKTGIMTYEAFIMVWDFGGGFHFGTTFNGIEKCH